MVLFHVPNSSQGLSSILDPRQRLGSGEIPVATRSAPSYNWFPLYPPSVSPPSIGGRYRGGSPRLRGVNVVRRFRQPLDRPTQGRRSGRGADALGRLLSEAGGPGPQTAQEHASKSRRRGGYSSQRLRQPLPQGRARPIRPASGSQRPLAAAGADHRPQGLRFEKARAAGGSGHSRGGRVAAGRLAGYR